MHINKYNTRYYQVVLFITSSFSSNLCFLHWLIILFYVHTVIIHEVTTKDTAHMATEYYNIHVRCFEVCSDAVKKFVLMNTLYTSKLRRSYIVNDYSDLDSYDSITVVGK